MKAMIDVLVSLKVEKPVVGGILVKGFKCFVYKMDLEYEAIYRMTEITNFSLIDDFDDLMRLPRIVEVLMQLKSIIDKTARNVLKSFSNRERGIDLGGATPMEFRRPSYGSPERMP